MLCTHSTWSTQCQFSEMIPVISQLDSFELGRYYFAWSLSQLEIRSMICSLGWIVRPLYKEDPLQNKTSNNQESKKKLFCLTPRGKSLSLSLVPNRQNQHAYICTFISPSFTHIQILLLTVKNVNVIIFILVNLSFVIVLGRAWQNLTKQLQ